MRVRQLARAVDDGYRNGLVPGLKASADAERLADEIAFAATRLAQLATDPPGTYAEAALEADREEGLWLAFLTAVVCPGEGEDPFAGVRAAHVPWASGELPDLAAVPRGLRSIRRRPAPSPPTARGRRAPAPNRPRWPARRRGRPSGASTACSSGSRCRASTAARATTSWSRRDGWASRTSEGAAMHFGDDATTLAAKRVFGIGDPILLSRRANELAEEAGVPVEALDLALFNWGQPSGGRVTMGAGEASTELRATVAAALDV